jgi:hypothetical protein
MQSVRWKIKFDIKRQKKRGQTGADGKLVEETQAQDFAADFAVASSPNNGPD